MKWLRDNWGNPILFIYASVWTAFGVFIAVNVVVDNQDLDNWESFAEILIFVNFAVYLVYSGLKTQLKLFSEWEKHREKE